MINISSPATRREGGLLNPSLRFPYAVFVVRREGGLQKCQYLVANSSFVARRIGGCGCATRTLR